MRTIVDLHMHSYYSRATSKRLNVPGIAKFGRMKGVDVIATGDITHPKWIAEIEKELVEDGSGFLQLRDNSLEGREMLFTLFGEVASIYKKDGIGRRVHTLFGVSNIAAVKKVNAQLQKLGFNITYDGRPIIGMDVVDLMQIYLDADPQALIIPAHIWTPWFAMFGSKSGFDSIEECFGDMSKYVYAIETGLSSDPDMNWRVSDLDKVAIISNSDAHSPEKIGREATVFDWEERTYAALYESLRHQKRIEYTIEFYPEEGKYHTDGHRSCNVSLEPEETEKLGGKCPKCKLPLVVGVMNRVQQLTDRSRLEVQAAAAERPTFKSIVPLPEIIASVFGVKSVASKKVQQEYEKLIVELGNEFAILLDVSESELDRVAHPLVSEGIKRMRSGDIHIVPGYDGVFGVIEIFTDAERAALQPQQAKLL